MKAKKIALAAIKRLEIAANEGKGGSAGLRSEFPYGDEAEVAYASLGMNDKDDRCGELASIYHKGGIAAVYAHCNIDHDQMANVLSSVKDDMGDFSKGLHKALTKHYADDEDVEGAEDVQDAEDVEEEAGFGRDDEQDSVEEDAAVKRKQKRK